MNHVRPASQRPETYRSAVGEARFIHTFRVVWNPVGDGVDRAPDTWANQLVFHDHDDALEFIGGLLHNGVASFAVAHNISPEIGRPQRSEQAETTEVSI